MAEGKDKKRKRGEITEEESGKKSKKKQTAAKKDAPSTIAGSLQFLAANSAVLDPTLSSLFAASPAISKPNKTSASLQSSRRSRVAASQEVDVDNEESADEKVLKRDVEGDIRNVLNTAKSENEPDGELEDGDRPARKRKRKDEHDDLEGAYMQKLAKSRDKEDADRRKERKQSKAGVIEGADDDSAPDKVGDEDTVDEESEDDDVDVDDLDEDALPPPPQHESLDPGMGDDMVRAQRTVFLGNVSVEAIRSKTARKALMAHLASFFPSMAEPKDGEPPHAVESLRFRSTPFANAIPKKAAFARKELMDATAKSTNAYAVYSSNALVREAARKLNGTIVLDRHLRVDEVAHPAKTDHRRCVFVGNLGFVDDESNIDKANEAEGYRTNHGNKRPADVEEGLWRTFAQCGTVESVRVVRDSKTRVGKGIAYVQFTDENGVEAALEYEGKRFPPMLPRKLRVSRAKAIKRNARPNPESTRAAPMRQPKAKGAKGAYVPKLTPEQLSQLGRANRMLGRSAAAHMKRDPVSVGRKSAPRTQTAPTTVGGVRAPESFVFEGHRASSQGGKAGLKLGGKGKKKAKPTKNSGKRAAAFKATGGKPARD